MKCTRSEGTTDCPARYVWRNKKYIVPCRTVHGLYYMCFDVSGGARLMKWFRHRASSERNKICRCRCNGKERNELISIIRRGRDRSWRSRASRCWRTTARLGRSFPINYGSPCTNGRPDWMAVTERVDKKKSSNRQPPIIVSRKRRVLFQFFRALFLSNLRDRSFLTKIAGGNPGGVF